MCPSGLDIRTDLPKYKVFRHGKLEKEVLDITELWTDDMVIFLLGCSFSFEEELYKNGYKIRHIEQKKNVPMYDTSIPCTEAGIFKGTMVVSMRPYKEDEIEAVSMITS